MAGNAKPNIEKLGPEGVVLFDGTTYHDGVNADKLESLLDSDINAKTRYGVLISTNVKSHFKFYIPQKSNIYAYGTSYSDGGGSTPKRVSLYKVEQDGTSTMIKSDVPTKMDQWYLLFGMLDAGWYQIKINSTTDNYCKFTEWYVERLSQFLIKKNNKYYSIIPDLYSNGKYNNLGESVDITKQESNKYMENDIKNYVKETTILDETFRPIDKFDKCSILIKK